MFAVIVAGATLGACNNDPAESTGDSSGSTSTGADGSSSSGEPTPTTGEGTTEAGTTGETTGDEPLTRIEQILAALEVAMYQCPERVWPDVEANYRTRQVLMASELENRAWLWNDQQGAGEPPVVTEGPLDKLPPEWTSVFNVNTLGSALTLGISLDWTQETNDAIIADGGTPWPDYATSLAFHEAFHFLSDQDDWSAGNGSREAPYPEPWEPRYLRAQLESALLAEVSDGPGLAAAAHWHGRLLAEHGDEMDAIRSYDCTEGSAEYVSLMMSAVAELGCDAPDEELLALAISHLKDGIFIDEGGFDVGREPYDLGVLAGLILRRDAAAGWELKVEDGDAPADQVLAGVAAEVQPDDPAVQADAQAAVAARNAEVGAEIEPMLANMKDPDYTRIVVSFNWIAGSFGVGGFYYLADDPNLSSVLLTFSASLEPPSQVPIEITGLTALSGIDTPCALAGGPVIALAVPTSDLTVVGGAATVNSAKLEFAELAVEATMDAEALPWLCPVDAGGAGGAVAPEPGPALHVLRAADGQMKGVVRPRIGPFAAR
jgi:hypothetical protein